MVPAKVCSHLSCLDNSKANKILATPHVAGIVAYLIGKDGIFGVANIRNRIVSLSTKNKVIDPKGSYNRLAYNGNGW